MSEAKLIVADTGPLIALSCADAIDLLRNLYTHVYVPPAVANELAAGSTRVGGDLLARHSWLEVRAPSAQPEPLLREELDAGEAEAITLAVELGRVGVLPALAPVLERLVQGGIFLSPKLIEDALRAVGER